MRQLKTGIHQCEERKPTDEYPGVDLKNPMSEKVETVLLTKLGFPCELVIPPVDQVVAVQIDLLTLVSDEEGWLARTDSKTDMMVPGYELQCKLVMKAARSR